MKKDKTPVVFFVTGNVHKFHEARSVLSKYNIATAMLNIEAVEIQDDDLKRIAIASAFEAAQKSGLPVFVEDAGLFIKALNGFPGPYSSYVYRSIGRKGVLKLMEKIRQRGAYFRSVVAFCSSFEKTNPSFFDGRVNGDIAHEERGAEGFGFDPVFQPKNVIDKTFAEMTIEEKNKHSHRARALQKFAKWYRHWWLKAKTQ